MVHEAHGIGRYLGLETLTIDGVTRDYISIQYAGSDKLFLPCDRLDAVSKYIGAHADDGLVKLSRFGGGEWKKAKAKAKAAVKDMAKDLIRLYAERERRAGYAFPPDDDYQRDFEAAFEYNETDGQLNAAAEIKEDMESAVPMDRLLCGDVGFGKTEVALRAAYKGVGGQTGGNLSADHHPCLTAFSDHPVPHAGIRRAGGYGFPLPHTQTAGNHAPAAGTRGCGYHRGHPPPDFVGCEIQGFGSADH